MFVSGGSGTRTHDLKPMRLASCQLLHSAIMTRRLAVFELRLEDTLSSLQHYSYQGVLIAHYLAKRMQERRGQAFRRTTHGRSSAIGWVVVGDAHPVPELHSCGAVLIPSILIGPNRSCKMSMFTCCGKGEIRTPGVSYVLDLQSSAHPPSEQPSRCG